MPTEEWGLRLGAVVLLIFVHVGVWRPVRNVLTEAVAYPLVVAIDTPRSREVALELEPRAVRAEAGGEVYRYHMPAALSYLVVAVALVAVWPRRLYWLALWAAHVVLGVLAFGAFLIGVGWSSLGYAASDFAQLYLVPALGLVALVAVTLPISGTEETA